MKPVFISILITSGIAFALPIGFVAQLTLIFAVATLWFVYAMIRFGMQIRLFKKAGEVVPNTLVGIFLTSVAGLVFGAALVLGAEIIKLIPTEVYQLLLTYSYSIAVTSFGVMAWRIDKEKK